MYFLLHGLTRRAQTLTAGAGAGMMQLTLWPLRQIDALCGEAESVTFRFKVRPECPVSFRKYALPNNNERFDNV